MLTVIVKFTVEMLERYAMLKVLKSFFGWRLRDKCFRASLCVGKGSRCRTVEFYVSCHRESMLSAQQAQLILLEPDDYRAAMPPTSLRRTSCLGNKG